MKYGDPLIAFIIVALIFSAAVGIARHDPIWRVSLPLGTALAWAFIWWRKGPHSNAA